MRKCFQQKSLIRSFGGNSGDLKLAALLDEDGQLAVPPARIRRLESHIYQGALQSSISPTHG